MSGQKEFDPEFFQAEILTKVDLLQERYSYEDKFIDLYDSGDKISTKGRPLSWWLPFGLHRVAQKLNQKVLRDLAQDPKRANAQQLIAQDDIKRRLCPALHSAGSNASEIAKIITPILAPLILDGTLAIPLDPLLFAMGSLEISRIGIASYCQGYKELAGETS
jgi:hypothetical protein